MPTNEELKATQRERWDAAASSWEKQDAWREQQTRAVIDWLCEASGAKPGMRVLDLACGSGQPALNVARLVLPGGSVVATDLSDNMVALVARRAAAIGLTNVETRQMDMEALDFAAASFDAATCRWGLMFPPDPSRAASEIARVLKPGAYFAAATWDTMDKNPYMTLINETIAKHGGAVPPNDRNTPGPLRLSDPRDLERLLRDGGFSEATAQPLAFEWDFATPEEFWENRMSESVTNAGPYASLSAADQSRVKAEVLEGAKRYLRDGRVRFPASTLVVRARR